MFLKGMKINFLGDSITYGVGTSGSASVYHAQLKLLADLREVKSYGINGTRYARQEGDKNESFCDRYAGMDEDADMVVVFGGTNDYGHGRAPLGTFADRTPDTFYGACHYLYRGLIKKYLGKPVIVITPLHRLNEMCRSGDNKPCEVATLKVYVDIIKEVAEYYSLPVLDLYACSGIQPEIPEIRKLYVPDGVHPNDNGHRVIADKLYRFLQQQ